jgi:hypothetical protein
MSPLAPLALVAGVFVVAARAQDRDVSHGNTAKIFPNVGQEKGLKPSLPSPESRDSLSIFTHDAHELDPATTPR